MIGSKYNSDQQTAIKMYLSRRQFSRVLRSLNRLSELKAFPFAVVCVAAQLIEIEDYKDLLEEIFDGFVTRFFDYDQTRLASLKVFDSNTVSVISDGGDFATEQSDEPTENTTQSKLDATLRQCWTLFSGKFVAN